MEETTSHSLGETKSIVSHFKFPLSPVQNNFVSSVKNRLTGTVRLKTSYADDVVKTVVHVILFQYIFKLTYGNIDFAEDSIKKKIRASHVHRLSDCIPQFVIK